MNKSIWAMLTPTEQTLLVETERARIANLDEDDLLALHDRVRRARNKYSKLYRRRGRTQVTTDRARGRASAVNAKTAAKAEVFEDALGRVSRQLARAATASASALKQERLAAARKHPKPKAAARKQPAKRTRGAVKQAHTPARKRARAQARSTTRRVEAKRAGRT